MQFKRLFSSIQSVRGMNDLYGKDLEMHNFIINKGKKLFDHYGYQEVILNILEHKQVFDRSLGDQSDVIKKEMYILKDNSENDLVLRPEGTSSMVRFLLEKQINIQKNQKYYYSGPMYRYERPQKGRYRQFNQIGLELFDQSDSLSDVEAILLGFKFLHSLNENQKLKIEINSLGDLESRIQYTKKLQEYFTQQDVFNNLSEDSKSRLRRKNPLRIFDSKDKQDIQASKQAPNLNEYLTQEASEKFKKVQNMLLQCGINFQVNHQLVRGLDYYNGICFEFKADNEHSLNKQQNTILAGGRYDMLASQMSGKLINFPGVGWAAGIERLKIELLEEAWEKINQNTIKKIKFGIVGIIQKDTPEDTVSMIKQRIIQIYSQSFKFNNQRFEFHMINSPKKIDKKFEKLNKENYDYAIIVGENELQNEKIHIKDLNLKKSDFIEFSQIQEYVK